jgi:hypothetical protein
MKRPCSIFVLFVLLAFGVSLAVPAEDVPETAYDESEALPFEGTPLLSTIAPETVTAAVVTCASPPRFGFSGNRCQRRLDYQQGFSDLTSDSLAMVNQSLRC